MTTTEKQEAKLKDLIDQDREVQRAIISLALAMVRDGFGCANSDGKVHPLRRLLNALEDAGAITITD